MSLRRVAFKNRPLNRIRNVMPIQPKRCVDVTSVHCGRMESAMLFSGISGGLVIAHTKDYDELPYVLTPFTMFFAGIVGYASPSTCVAMGIAFTLGKLYTPSSK